MTRKRKQLTYPDLQLPCPICGRYFKTLQGLSGHSRFAHGLESPGGPVRRSETAGGSAGSSTATLVKDLKTEVETLKLQLEKRKLQAELPTPAAELPDLMQRLGLGPFDPEVRAVVQRRAVNATEQEPRQNWLDKLLSSPEGIKIAVEGLKGVLGVGQPGDSTADLLRDMGFSLKDLISQATAPKAGEGLSVAGISLAGSSLTPELLKSVMEYKAAEEKAKGDFESRKLMADSLERAVGQLAPAIGDLLASRQGNPGPGPIQRRPGGPEVQESQQAAECPKCGLPIAIPPGFGGGTLRCTTKLADTAGGGTCLGQIDLEVIEDQPESTPGRKKRKPKPKPEQSLKCADCGQLIDISSREIGDEIRCPICESQFKIVSDRESLPALEALSEKEKQDRAFRDRKEGYEENQA